MLAPKNDYGFANDKTLGLGKIGTGLGRVAVPIGWNGKWVASVEDDNGLRKENQPNDPKKEESERLMAWRISVTIT